MGSRRLRAGARAAVAGFLAASLAACDGTSAPGPEPAPSTVSSPTRLSFGVWGAPDEVRQLVDLVLRGVVRGDFADTLWRAAAFARVTAAGRAELGASGSVSGYASDVSASRLVTMAEQLEHAARLEVRGELG